MQAHKPTRDLPSNYTLAGTIDLSKDGRMMIILNGIGVALFLGSAWLLLLLAAAIRPKFGETNFRISGSLNSLAPLLAWIIGLTVLMLIVHEGIHGLFFWIFTGSRPRFGFRGYYAFAAAPDWFIPYRHYLVVALSPVVLMTLIGIGTLWVIPEAWLGGLIFWVSMNFSGSVGDMMVAAWLLRKPATFLAQDYGDGVRFYGPA
jgi:hypothetical protein